MSDLISRSEVLIAMDTWDKFGYDEHNRLIRIDSTNEEYVPYVRYEDMVNCVMNMPTAYSVEKVVEELEEIINPKEMYFCRVSKGRCIHNEDDIECIDCVAQMAIKIVKQNS